MDRGLNEKKLLESLNNMDNFVESETNIYLTNIDELLCYYENCIFHLVPYIMKELTDISEFKKKFELFLEQSEYMIQLCGLKQYKGKLFKKYCDNDKFEDNKDDEILQLLKNYIKLRQVHYNVEIIFAKYITHVICHDHESESEDIFKLSE